MLAHRPWLSGSAAARVHELTDAVAALDADALDARITRLVGDSEALVDHRVLNLYAGTNMPNPKVSALLASTIGSRPSLGLPGAKYNRGTTYVEELDVICASLLADLFGARHAEFRVGSGSLANLYVYMATTKPGDVLLSFSDLAGGHPTHHAAGAAGLYGLDIHDVPYNNATMDIDLEGLAAAVERLKPKLVIVAGSLCLHPYSLREASAIAHQAGARVLYDAAHMGGIIAGGAFQDPLGEGADLMTGSTYKSFGGPPSGLVVTNSDELAERLDAIAYPGLTANFDLSKTAALAMAALDLKVHGRAYAAAALANAAALAEALQNRNVPVHTVAGKGATSSQHVALDARQWGGGSEPCHKLEAANIIATTIGLPVDRTPGDDNGIRLGTQELTRWGMEPADMDTVADLMARVLVGGEPPSAVRPDTEAFRSGFQTLHYIRD